MYHKTFIIKVIFWYLNEESGSMALFVSKRELYRKSDVKHTHT